MFKLIEKLRQKPDGVKKRIAFLVSLLFSGIIFVFWVADIYPTLVEKKEKIDYVKSLEPSPLKTFGESFKVSMSAMSEQLNNIKNSITSMSAEPVYYSTTTKTFFIPADSTGEFFYATATNATSSRND